MGWKTGHVHLKTLDDAGNYDITVSMSDPALGGIFAPFDVEWHDSLGTADSLRLRTDSHYDDLSGDLVNTTLTATRFLGLEIDGDVDSASAELVHIFAEGDLGTVNATGTIYAAMAGGSIGSTTSALDTWRVSAGFHYNDGPAHIGSVTASQGNIGVVAAAGNIGSVTATGDGQASGHIGHIDAGGNITGPISADASIGLRPAPTSSYNDYFSYGYDDYVVGVDPVTGESVGVGGVRAGGTISSNISAGNAAEDGGPEGSLTFVEAQGDVGGEISASGDIYEVRSVAGSIIGEVDADGNIARVKAELDITNTVFGNNIGIVASGRHITGDVISDEQIGGVFAGENLGGSVTALDGSIIAVHAAWRQDAGVRTGNLTSPLISATENIGIIQVHATDGTGDIDTDSIEATDGRIGDILATGAINAEITAGLSIGNVSALRDVSGSLTATQSYIRGVRSNSGEISASITAGTHVGDINAELNITGIIQAGSTSDIISNQGNISGNVTAQQSIGNVSAGKNVDGEVTAVTGSIGDVTAGTAGQGSITQNITAGQNIGRVRAGVIPSGQVSSISEPSGNPLGALLDWLNSDNPDDQTRPAPEKPGKVNLPFVGDISGEVIATAGSIVSVAAQGHITKIVKAGSKIGHVWALGNIDAVVESSIGNLFVNAWGEIKGAVKAVGTAIVRGFDGVHSNVESTGAAVSVFSYGNVTGQYFAAKELLGEAWGKFTATVSSQDSSVQLTGLDDVKVKGDGKERVVISTYGSADVELESRNSDAVVLSAKEQTGKVKAKNEVIVSSMEDIRTAIEGKDTRVETHKSYIEDLKVEESIKMVVWHSVEGNIQSTTGHIYIDAAEVSGSVVADQGLVGLDVFGQGIDATIKGKQGVSISSNGEVKGTVSSSAGAVLLTSLHGVSANVSGDQGVVVLNWGFTDRGVSGQFNSDAGSVWVFSHGDITGSVTAAKDIDVSSWGTVSATIDATENASVFSRKNVTELVKAAQNLMVTAVGDITGEVQSKEGSAYVYTNGDLKKNVTAGGDIVVDALGKIESDFHATSGSVSITTRDSYSGTVKAGKDVGIRANAAVSGGSILGGEDVTVVTAGTIDTASITSSAGDVNLSAFGDINSANVDGKNEVNVTSDGSVTIGHIQAGTGLAGLRFGGEVSVSAHESITDLNIRSGGDVHVFSGDSAKLDVNSTHGETTAISLKKLDGTFFSGSGIQLAAFGSEGLDATATAPLGEVSMVSGGQLTGTANSGLGIGALAAGALSGNYTTLGATSLSSGQNVDATVSSGGNVV